MEDYEPFPDEEEEAVAEEGANRTFIILVSALGGLLAVGICAFVVWAFFIAPGMRNGVELQNEATFATNTARAALAEAGTLTPETPPETTEPPAPSDTPAPTETEPPTQAPETPEATPGEGTEEPASTAAAVAEATPSHTATPQATPRPTATRRPTATPKSGNDELPGTGLGTVGTGALAVGLLLLLAAVRRMRKAA